jgi:hypothetical protein
MMAGQTMDTNVTIVDSSTPIKAGSDIAQLVRQTLQQSLAGVTKLVPEILAMPGMSGRKYRSFINNLVERFPAPRYLEVGSWAGSTLCSAIHGNDVEAVAIDNWSQFGGPCDSFLRHLSLFKGAARVSFLEKDFREIDYAHLGSCFGRFNIYLFDGPHSFDDQYDGLVVAQPALEQVYVQIVDDWNWADVRNGTMKAITDRGLNIDFMCEIRTTFDNSHAQPSRQESDWHNGYFIGVLSRQS